MAPFEAECFEEFEVLDAEDAVLACRFGFGNDIKEPADGGAFDFVAIDFFVERLPV